MDAENASHGVSLAKLFTRRRFFHSTDILVSSCCTDWRRCRVGDLYVAFLDADAGQDDQIREAVAKGAKAILTERLLPLQIPQCVVPNTKTALAYLCQKLVGNPADQVPVIGVAGESGKAATQVLLTRVLESVGQNPAVFGSLGFTDGHKAFPRLDSRTSAAQYAQWLANVAANGCSQAITELSQPEVANRVHAGVPLQSLLLTGFETHTPQKRLLPRLEFYLSRILAPVSTSGLVVANIDCPTIRDVVRTIDRPVLTVSIGGQADITASILEQFPSEQTFLIDAGDDTAVVRTKIIGAPYVRHCLLAAASALAMGYELCSIVSALESIDSIPGYLERVECGQPYSVFADASLTPIELRNSLQTLRKATTGRLLCLFGQGETTKKPLRSLRGKTVERFADQGVITSDDAADREPLRAIHDVLDGFSKPAKAHVMPNRIRAIEWLLEQAKPGDTVLLAGPHNRRFIREPDDFYSDADVARHWLFESAKNDPDSFSRDDRDRRRIPN